ncbi:hypothetical protein CRE_27650 [Caenorhabditis remanei]|uniref:Uncharacterized protein n=1 Tax=Caenorhabditis remanei TaxID=31234 RepID=E3MKR3_CAERE|nr:hypothetical protein CRE_27650 [Caenorhabditis remanei]
MEIDQFPIEVVCYMLKYLSVSDLFFLSLSSNDFYNAVKRIKVNSCLTISKISGECALKLICPDAAGCLVFNTRQPEHRDLIMRRSILRMGNEKIKVKATYFIDNCQTTLHIRQKDIPKMMGLVFNYINELFNPTDICLNMKLKNVEKYFQDNTVYTLNIMDKSVDVMRVEKVLSELTVEGHLIALGKITGKLKTNSKINSMNQLHVRGKWMTPAQILKFDGEHALFDNTLFTTKDIGLFLNAWMNGAYPNLETLIINSKNTLYPSEVTPKLVTKPWDPKQRSRHYKYRSRMIEHINRLHLAYVCDCGHDGFDIERKSDGLLATFKISWNHFFFFVWNDRFS